jgi:hypothetical protein
MLKTYTWTGLLLGVLVVTGLLYTQSAKAASVDPAFQVSFDTGTSNIRIEGGNTYPIAGIAGSLGVSRLSSSSPPFSVGSSELYKQQDGGNLLVAQGTNINPVVHSIGPVTLVAGTYSLHVTEGSPPTSAQTIPQKLFAYIVQTAHAAADTTIITFTVTDVAEVEEDSSSSRSRSTYGRRIPRSERDLAPEVVRISGVATLGKIEQLSELVGTVTILSGRKEEMNEQQRALISSILTELQKFLKSI